MQAPDKESPADLQAEFLLLDPGYDANQSDQRCNDDSPRVDVQRIDVECGPCRGNNGR